MPAASNLIARFVTYIIDPAILLVFTAGFLMFIWGLVQFLMNIEEGGSQDTGKKHMVWGVVGMLIMVSVYGIIAMLDNSFHLDIANPDVNRIGNVTAPANFFGR